MKFCFYYPFEAQKDWNGHDLDGEGLPGTEASIARLAREWAGRHEVTVFNKTSREGQCQGVSYRNLSKFNYRTDWDVLLLVRGRLPHLSRASARLKLYWPLEEGPVLGRDWEQILPFVQRVISISPFHTEKLLRTTPVPREKIFETRLGVGHDEYVVPLPKIKNKLIFCSVPRRGLKQLREIFPVIKQAVPEASLVITSDYSLWGRKPQNGEYVRAFKELPGVRFMGRVSRQRLVDEQKTSWLHIYPCTFEELFCLSAMECQAAGTPSVCTDLGALPTTILDGVTGKIINNCRRNIDVQGFAAEVIKLLRNPPAVDKLAAAARERALRDFSIEQVAREWESYFVGCLTHFV